MKYRGNHICLGVMRTQYIRRFGICFLFYNNSVLHSNLATIFTQTESLVYN